VEVGGGLSFYGLWIYIFYMVATCGEDLSKSCLFSLWLSICFSSECVWVLKTQVCLKPNLVIPMASVFKDSSPQRLSDNRGYSIAAPIISKRQITSDFNMALRYFGNVLVTRCELRVVGVCDDGSLIVRQDC
jgi:hypothetical protein